MSIRNIAGYAFGLVLVTLLLVSNITPVQALAITQRASASSRGRVSINSDWRFSRFTTNPDKLSYDLLKQYILPAANNFVKGSTSQRKAPTGSPGSNVSYVQSSFDDSKWETVNLPHDWAIKGPFYSGDPSPVPSGMGRLPIQGVGWYRKTLRLTNEDEGKTIYLDIDGAMSYAMVWLNGNFVGGWLYGYNSFRLDLTPHVKFGQENQLAIRLDNPTDSARWYPGGGIYRNVWLTKVNPTHVAQWGTYVTTKDVSVESATVDLVVQVRNSGKEDAEVEVVTDLYPSNTSGSKVGSFRSPKVKLAAGETKETPGQIKVSNPQLWGPWTSSNKPNLYVAVTRVMLDGEEVDTYETTVGIRSIVQDPNKGLIVNGEHVLIQGANQHHDLGALGSAFNVRAAQRQLEILKEAGINAIRMSHNPPAPELLDLTDSMGFLVLDEIFDCWQREKTANDFHLIFDDWSEPDLRAFLRRDRNHPSIFAWSYGNEVGEQYTDADGARISQRLHDIVKEEDPTRPSTSSMNYAKPDMPFPRVLDVISLNYQGEGIRNAPEYSHLTNGIHTEPLYPSFHSTFPTKMILGSETSASMSSRGSYLFPVTSGESAPVSDTSGGNSRTQRVSDYGLYSADFGSSPDKTFATQDRYPYVAGQFVWSGWDYLGEPTPYYTGTTRSSYFGFIDLAGFPKDRFYLYQARWRPDHAMAHILPHWTWPGREDQVTPVHVFTSGDEAELFVNGASQGRLKKGQYQYRLRWDNIKYTPGQLKVVAYKEGKEWANATVNTAGSAAKLRLTADRSTITGDGLDLSFIKAEVLDKDGNFVPQSANSIIFAVSGGELVATDNGAPDDMTPFPSKERKAFNGLALAIVRSKAGSAGPIKVSASGNGLAGAEVTIELS
jgi:beta-galactosidase